MNEFTNTDIVVISVIIGFVIGWITVTVSIIWLINQKRRESRKTPIKWNMTKLDTPSKKYITYPCECKTYKGRTREYYVKMCNKFRNNLNE